MSNTNKGGNVNINIGDQLCDAKAKIATLESNAFTAGALNNAVTTIIKHMPATTTTTTAG